MNIYILTSSALDFKQFYMIYKFYLIKRIFSSERIPYCHIRQRHYTVQVKHSYTIPSLCVLYFAGSKRLKFS